MQTIFRYDFADYLGIKSGETTTFHLMGAGFNTLDENPNAQVESKAYINQKVKSNVVKGYETQFPFDTDLIQDEVAVMAIYDVGRDAKTGASAEFDFIRVELFKPETSPVTKCAARKFRVSVEVSSIAGAGADIVRVTGNLNAVGDFVDGFFDTATKVFTAAT